MNGFSDRGSIPLSSTYVDEKGLLAQPLYFCFNTVYEEDTVSNKNEPP